MPATPASKVRVRTYRHGLGDCHLVRFTKPDGSPFHLLIDCGVVNRTKNPGPLMTGVAADIATETGGVLDLVVATHQHTDHLSGFEQARPAFDAMKMKRLWLAWTEDPANPLGKKIQQQLLNKLAAVREARSRLAAEKHPAARRIDGVLDFFGTLGVQGEDTQVILDWLQDKSELPPEYHGPGETFLLPEVPNVRVYVLGPPKNADDLKITNPRKSKHEGYEISLAASSEGFAEALGFSTGDGDAEMSHPFEKRHRITPAKARDAAFFRTHYFGPERETKQSQEWRRIDTAWLEAADQLALFLSDFTNNTSLALAFEFIDTGEVLLFPGDAQIGSWLTWHTMKWTFTEPGGARRRVSIGDLFARTVFYKASHHASHNGTLSGLGAEQTGLEQMTDRNLVCVVPVDLAMSKEMGWDRTLPWEPLLTALRVKTRGRLVLTDTAATPPKAAALKTLSAAERKRFAKQVTVAPGWVDYTL